MAQARCKVNRNLACHWCENNLFFSKLGRCRGCLLKSVLFALLLSLLGLLLIGLGYPLTHLYSLSALICAALFWGLLALHLLFGGWRLLRRTSGMEQ